MPIQNKKKDLIALSKKGGNDATLMLLNKIYSLEEELENLEALFQKIKKDLVDNLQNDSVLKEQLLDKVQEKAVMKLALKIAYMRKGDDGHTPTKKELLTLIRPLIPARITDTELRTLIIPLIPKPLNGIDGKDADEEIIVSKVLRKIPPPEEVILDGPDEIRNKLELLQGKERLALEAIKGLKKELEEIRIIRSRKLGGGGFSKIHMESKFVDDETPTGNVNSTNKDFVLEYLPNPTASLKVYVNGQKMTTTEDYTLSSKTITLTTAPPTGSIVRCDYRK